MAHEEGNLNDLRAILGNDEAIKTSRIGLGDQFDDDTKRIQLRGD